jgi:tetratricopeptide (TPR) repeat protein
LNAVLADNHSRLFRLLGLRPGPEFSLQAAAALAALAVPRTRQLLDSLVGAHLLEQTAPDRYQFHDLLRAYATDQAHHEEPPDLRNAALGRVLTWYLRTADAAQSRLSPAEVHLSLTGSVPDLDIRPTVFADYDAALDWSEREHVNLVQAVRSAVAAGLDPLAWQLAAVFWNVRSSAAPIADWMAVGELALEAARRSGAPEGEAHLLTSLGMDHARINDLTQSLRCHRRALELRRGTGDRLGEADSLNLIGLVHLRRRQLAQAADHFVRAIALFREEGSDHWAATALSNLATAHYNAGRLSEASAVAREALEAHHALDNQRGVGNLLRLRSCLQLERGELDEASRSARQAMVIASALRDQRLEAYWLLALADAQQANDLAADALISYQRSAALHRRLANRSREALAWYGTGNAYRRLGRDAEAAHFHRQAAATQHELHDAWNEALALDGLGQALAAAGDAGAAARHWAEALRLLGGYDDPRAAAVREDIRRRVSPTG